jgi:two-component system chemotaxis response regulator CheB
MDGLPARLPVERQGFTGLICPDCRGSLTVRLQGRLASFTCRIGHTYSLEELLVGKESALETRMWEAVYAFEEMAALLTDLDRHGLAQGIGPAACRERAGLTREQAIRLRSLIQVDRPLRSRQPLGRAGA